MPSIIARFCKHFSLGKKSKPVRPKALPHYYDCTPPQPPVYSVAIILHPTDATTTTTPPPRTQSPVPIPKNRNTNIASAPHCHSADDQMARVPAKAARSYYASENFPEGTSAYEQVRFIRAQDEVGTFNSFPSTRTARFREDLGDCGPDAQVRPSGGFHRLVFRMRRT